jgi:SSS family solute:Na+ symporter
LAQAAADEKERESYRKKILDAFLDLKGPDRLHAAETLGKLGYTGHRPEFLKVVKEETGSFQSMAQWVLANSGKEDDERALAALLDSPSEEARGCAAYALRFFKQLRGPTYAKLEAAAARESEDSHWRSQILSPLYVHATPASSKEDKREVCLALGRVPDAGDVPLLTKLLEDPELDVRSAASETLLRIAR